MSQIAPSEPPPFAEVLTGEGALLQVFVSNLPLASSHFRLRGRAREGAHYAANLSPVALPQQHERQPGCQQ
jgi:hypothetical protein